ncbi:transcription elongation factor-like protein s-ii [Aulographum hederae CBS 113979]|uniref:Transcription elongation factor n=1 Tax=Aulographum hederae CBS 113979 TaxID=1176131 RepID=A0A6G1GZG0_9PEZI|nr:transcription elongation factor-like protein s-ii [Aulographum hederae CBS 113979]
MEAAVVTEKGKQLVKAMSDDAASDQISIILDELKTGVKASEQLLRSTRIGVTVGRLRSNKDPAIAKKATDLVGKWKVDVRKSTNSGASTPKTATANGTSSPANKSSSPAPKAKAKSSVPPEKRNCETDNVDYHLTGSENRDKCVKLMYDGLAFMSKEATEDLLHRARQVELSMYEAYKPESSDAYKGKIRSLFQNLKNKSNPQLRVRVFSGEITPDRFVHMTHEELKSAERKAEEAKIQKENLNNSMVAQEEKSISASLTCGKCHQKKVSYSQAQTRSADEPMTTFCECMNCGNRWKFS